ncbi:MAG TPA: DUF5683 domain-containing protein, partial [Ferruginibacter sp.]|nr:DUF5683 domain-containing protein [Ferruginibacter sp.]
MVILKLIGCALIFLSTGALAQEQTAIVDSSGNIKTVKPLPVLPDTSKKYSPRKAILRSAILPGWGQATNKKYWKIPIVYAALGTTAFIFFRNIGQYRDARSAYKLAIDLDTSNDFMIKEPYFSVKSQPERIRNFRNE